MEELQLFTRCRQRELYGGVAFLRMKLKGDRVPNETKPNSESTTTSAQHHCRDARVTEPNSPNCRCHRVVVGL